MGICNNCGYTFNSGTSGSGSGLGIGTIVIIIIVIALLSGVFRGKKSTEASITVSTPDSTATTEHIVDSWVTPILSDFTYKFENQGIAIFAYNGTGTSLIIPSSYMVEGQSVPVLSVDLQFKRDRKIANLIFSEGIKRIDCDIWGNGLQSVYLPASLERVPSFVYDDGGIGTLFYGGSENQWDEISFSSHTRSDVKFRLFLYNSTVDDCMNTINKPLKVQNTTPDGYEPLENFEYDVKDGHLVLGKYRGKNTIIRISPSYVVDNSSYTVSELYKTFYGTKADLVIIPDSVTTADNEVFNTARVKTIFIPSSLTNVTDIFFKMLYDVDSVYYGGSEEQWKAVCPVDRFDLHILHICYEATTESIVID